MLGAPSGVDDPKIDFLDPEREIEEPLNPESVILAILADLSEEGLVLVTVFRALLTKARTKVMSVIHRIGRCPGDGVELVVPHHGASRSGVCHGPDEFEGAKLAGATVYKIADEDGCPAGMSPRAAAMPVAEISQQGLKLVGMAVDVADDVVVHTANLVPCPLNGIDHCLMYRTRRRPSSPASRKAR